MPRQTLHYLLTQKVLLVLLVLKRLDELLSLTYPNGVTTTYSYNSTGYLTELLTLNSQLKTLNSYGYTYDRIGNRLTKTETDKRYDYAYDSIYRLLQSIPVKLKGERKEEGGKDKDKKDKDDKGKKGKGGDGEKGEGGKAEVFTYDPAGNKLTGPKDRDYYIYNEGNQLIEDRKHRYEYDRNGNLIRKVEVSRRISNVHFSGK